MNILTLKYTYKKMRKLLLLYFKKFISGFSGTKNLETLGNDLNYMYGVYETFIGNS